MKLELRRRFCFRLINYVTTTVVKLEKCIIFKFDVRLCFDRYYVE